MVSILENMDISSKGLYVVGGTHGTIRYLHQNL